MLLYLVGIVLSLSVSVGLSPLKTTAKLTLSPEFAAGTVCLIWESADEAATPGSDCWTVENPRQRTWVKPLTLRTGNYVVWATQVGQDDRGNSMELSSPGRTVEVY